MGHPDPLTLLILGSLHRKVDRLLAGQTRQERRDMHIKDLLDQEGVALDQLEADDAAVLAKLAEQGELSPAEVEQAQTILNRIAALDAGDVAALTPGTQPAPGGDSGTTPGGGDSVPGGAGDGGDVPVVENPPTVGDESA